MTVATKTTTAAATATAAVNTTKTAGEAGGIFFWAKTKNICVTICIGRESWCLQYAGFFDHIFSILKHYCLHEKEMGRKIVCLPKSEYWITVEWIFYDNIYGPSAGKLEIVQKDKIKVKHISDDDKYINLRLHTKYKKNLKSHIYIYI